MSKIVDYERKNSSHYFEFSLRQVVNCVPDEVIPAHFFEDGPEPEPEPNLETGNTKMPPELATPPELKRGQILWIRGLTRLQTQVSAKAIYLLCSFWLSQTASHTYCWPAPGKTVRICVSARHVPLWSKIEKNRQNSHPIIHCPTSEGVSEVSERANE